jgi:hypothetical protein
MGLPAGTSEDKNIDRHSDRKHHGGEVSDAKTLLRIELEAIHIIL